MGIHTLVYTNIGIICFSLCLRNVGMYVCTYVSKYVCMYVYVCMYMYVYPLQKRANGIPLDTLNTIQYHTSVSVGLSTVI